jgi:anti-sigma factor RsiW
VAYDNERGKGDQWHKDETEEPYTFELSATPGQALESGASIRFPSAPPDGMSIPEQLARREEWLGRLAEARATIAARARERHARAGRRSAAMRLRAPPHRSRARVRPETSDANSARCTVFVIAAKAAIQARGTISGWPGPQLARG